MRLSTINQQLADAFSNALDARVLFQRVFWESYDSLGAEMRQELESEVELACLVDRKIPSSNDLSKMSEAFDECYFDLEDEGNFKASGRYFQKARITAAMAQASSSHSNQDFAEAAYEALAATDNPQLVGARIVSLIA